MVGWGGSGQTVETAVQVNSESDDMTLLPSALLSCHSSLSALHLLFQTHYLASHPTQVKDQGGPGAPQQPLSPAQLPEEAECLTVPKYKRDLVQKLKILRQELSQQQPQAGHCRIEVCREEIFEVKTKQETNKPKKSE